MLRAGVEPGRSERVEGGADVRRERRDQERDKQKSAKSTVRRATS